MKSSVEIFSVTLDGLYLYLKSYRSLIIPALMLAALPIFNIFLLFYLISNRNGLTSIFQNEPFLFFIFVVTLGVYATGMIYYILITKSNGENLIYKNAFKQGIKSFISIFMTRLIFAIVYLILDTVTSQISNLFSTSLPGLIILSFLTLYLGMRVIFCDYLIVLKGYSSIKAIQESWKLSDHRPIETFLILVLTSIPVTALCLIINFFVATPIENANLIQFIDTPSRLEYVNTEFKKMFLNNEYKKISRGDLTPDQKDDLYEKIEKSYRPLSMSEANKIMSHFFNNNLAAILLILLIGLLYPAVIVCYGKTLLS